MTNTTLSLSTLSLPSLSPADGGGVSGAPRVLLRLEGALLLAAAVVAYAHLGAGWGLFAAFFLVPDLAFVGYLGGPRLGAIAYNTTHSTIGWVLAAAASLVAVPALLPYALVGLAHVGFDRMLGYGLKYGTAFGRTHLGAIGRDAGLTPAAASRG